jgi:cell shape-determining protein MreC
MDKSLNEAATDKIRKYHADCNNNPNTISFMPAIVSTFIRILFLQTHRETDRFFAGSGVQSAQSNMGAFFHFHRAVFSFMLKSRVSSILAKNRGITY